MIEQRICICFFGTDLPRIASYHYPDAASVISYFRRHTVLKIPNSYFQMLAGMGMVDYVVHKNWCILWGFGISKMIWNWFSLAESHIHSTLECVGLHKHVAWKMSQITSESAISCHILNMMAIEEQCFSGDIFSMLFSHTNIKRIKAHTYMCNILWTIWWSWGLCP